jgi:hypothetical protein
MKTLATLPLVALVLALAPRADASDFGIQLHGKKGSIAVHIGDGHGYAHPAPRPVAMQHVWVPGHFETVQDRVWVEGRSERVWVEPVYQWHYDACGRATRVCVQQGYFDTVCTPGHYETCARQVWIEGCWRMRPCAY